MNYSLNLLRFYSYGYFFSTVFLPIKTFLDGSPLAELVFLTTISVVVFLNLGLLIHKIRKGLEEGRYWAWVAGLIIFTLMSLSPLFPPGIIGLFDLLKRDTRAKFNRVATS